MEEFSVARPERHQEPNFASPRKQHHQSLARFLWGEAWDQHFTPEAPEIISEAVEAVRCTYKDVARFFTDNACALSSEMTPDTEFLWNEKLPQKERFYTEVADCFLVRIRQNHSTIGIVIGHPSDWSSWYLRYVIFLPEYRSQGLFKRFLKGLIKVFQICSVHRLEMDISPLNRAQITLTCQLGFVQTGVLLTERWGTLTRLTYFVSEQHGSIFKRQFCLNP